MKVAALNCVFFILGIVLGLAFGTKQARDGGAVTGAGGPAGIQASPEPTPSTPRPAAETPEEPAVPEGVSADLSRALAAIPVDIEVKQGTGRISGRVATEDGKALAGVLVRATMQQESSSWGRRWRRGSGEPPDFDVERQVIELVRHDRWNRAARREARTDETGAYVVEGLADAQWSLAAYAKGYEVQPAPGHRVHSVKPGAEISFVARPLVEVAVEVLLPGGQRPKAAQIEVRPLAGGRGFRNSEYWAPDNPSIMLQPGMSFSFKSSNSSLVSLK